ILAGAIILIVIIGIISYVFSVNKKVASWQGKIYPGVTVYGVDLGGLNEEEAAKVLKEKLPDMILDKKLVVKVEDKTLELTYEELKPSYNPEEVAKEAMIVGKDEGTFTKNSYIKGKKTTNLDTKLSYDEEALVAFENKVIDEVGVKPINASIEINSGNISITDEVSGKTINKEELHNTLVDNINADPGNEAVLTFDLVIEEAKIKAEDLTRINGKISSYSTSYVNTGDGRVKNMEIAADIVNGTILMPGDEFSYNGLIGDTTPEKGYEKANTYVGNEIVPDYGGGICQVSTTLYRAVMNANIRSTERMNHSLTVSYSDPGLDATVANPYIDYKFVNTYDFPVYIQGSVSGGVVNFTLYGDAEAMGNKTYELVNEIHEKYNPEIKYEDDPTMEEGTEKVVSHGMPGYKASSYQVTYENGVEVDREFIATDVYMTTDTIVKRGTKKKDVPKKEDSKKEDPKKEDTTNNKTEPEKKPNN
ncbi:MAG: VanW family protein, partial [Clostridium sp.]|uniref:VanW family protein n=1 Tax=Clostridium sp. TaxID=1506 RepID=UPI002909193A